VHIGPWRCLWCSNLDIQLIAARNGSDGVELVGHERGLTRGRYTILNPTFAKSSQRVISISGIDIAEYEVRGTSKAGRTGEYYALDGSIRAELDDLDGIVQALRLDCF